MDSRPHWYNIYVQYHQTTLFSTIGVALDGGRYFTNVPRTDFLFDGCRLGNNVSYRYYVSGSQEIILHDFFYDDSSHEARYARECFEECILFFYSERERLEFNQYAVSKWENREEYLKDINVPYIETPKNYCKDAFREEYENALILKRLLDEYRTY